MAPKLPKATWHNPVKQENKDRKQISSCRRCALFGWVRSPLSLFWHSTSVNSLPFLIFFIECLSFSFNFKSHFLFSSQIPILARPFSLNLSCFYLPFFLPLVLIYTHKPKDGFFLCIYVYTDISISIFHLEVRFIIFLSFFMAGF